LGLPIDFGFLENIAGRSALHPDAAPPAGLVEAVREHLIILLNTRQGSVSYLPDYGLPDLAEIYKGYPESLHVLGRAIKKTIDRYESRLMQVNVELTASSSAYFEASYTITGFLDLPGQGRKGVSFRTVVGQNGRTDIE
jgi:type VI secretion system protein